MVMGIVFLLLLFLVVACKWGDELVVADEINIITIIRRNLFQILSYDDGPLGINLLMLGSW